MKFTIPKGKHRAKPLYWLRWFPLLIGRKSITRKVQFDFSAKYDIGADQADVNKLFGVSFGRVHRNSARFGWTYDKEINRFVLFAYIYNNGVREFHSLCSVVANHYYECKIDWQDDRYYFVVKNYPGEVITRGEFEKAHNKTWGFLLGLFFGGNRVATHNITVHLKK